MDGAHLQLAPDLATPADRGISGVAARPIRVVLADDHASMRRSLHLLLDFEDDIEVVAEARDLASVLRGVEGLQPRVLVLDPGMPDGSLSETIRELRRRAPETQIVIVTMEENPVFAQRALAAGAVGFVLKDLADEELPQAIHLAARCERYVSPRLALPLDELACCALGRGALRA